MKAIAVAFKRAAILTTKLMAVGIDLVTLPARFVVHKSVNTFREAQTTKGGILAALSETVKDVFCIGAYAGLGYMVGKSIAPSVAGYAVGVFSIVGAHLCSLRVADFEQFPLCARVDDKFCTPKAREQQYTI